MMEALHQAAIFFQNGEPQQAETVCRQILAADPTHSPTLHLLGLLARQDGRLDEAATLIRRSLEFTPASALALNDLGLILTDLGQDADAERHCRRALALDPGSIPGHNNLGKALYRLERLRDSGQSCRAAVSIAPDLAEPYSNLGNALRSLGRLPDAIACYHRALRLAPDLAVAHASLGAALHDAGQSQEGEDHCRHALRLCPSLALAHSNLGNILKKSGRLDEAETCCRRAVALKPDYADGHNNLGTTLQTAGALAQAMASFDTALHLQPGHIAAFKNALICAMYRDDMTHDQLTGLHRRFGNTFARTDPPLWRAKARDGGKLRIGYLSSDLRDHPVGQNLLPVLRHHDRTSVSLYFYAHVAKPDFMTARFQALAEGWHDIIGLSDQEVAARAASDGIDILVTLAGRLDGNRPLVASYRCAPVQVSLHDVATSGVDANDYIIGDPVLMPRQTEEYFSERRVRLPHFYIADAPQGLPDIWDHGEEEGPVFGCFNNPDKINPSVLGLWGRILAACPEATLRLRYQNAYASPRIVGHILDHLTAAGGRQDQVRFAAGTEPLTTFLAHYNEVDVALDTFPFSGSTTSFQALCMGVPVVTWPQDRMVSRWTASLLQTLKLDGLTASSADDYVVLALAAASQRRHWRSRRRQISAQVAASALCDGRRWCRHLERLYRAMHHRRQMAR